MFDPHSDSIPERIFQKSWSWEKNQEMTKSLKNSPVRKDLIPPPTYNKQIQRIYVPRHY